MRKNDGPIIIACLASALILLLHGNCFFMEEEECGTVAAETPAASEADDDDGDDERDDDVDDDLDDDVDDDVDDDLDDDLDDDVDDDTDPPFLLMSDAFDDGTDIPAHYTCEIDSADSPTGLSPPLNWQDAPEGTASFALTLRNSDNNDLVHWGLINIPGTSAVLDPEISPPGPLPLPNDAWETFEAGQIRGYLGPCWDVGRLGHHYVFTLHALNQAMAEPPAPVPLAEVQGQIDAASIGTAKLTAVY